MNCSSSEVVLVGISSFLIWVWVFFWGGGEGVSVSELNGDSFISEFDGILIL